MSDHGTATRHYVRFRLSTSPLEYPLLVDAPVGDDVVVAVSRGAVVDAEFVRQLNALLGIVEDE